MRSLSYITLVVLLFGCTNESVGGVSWASTPEQFDCEVHGYGDFPTGEDFHGDAEGYISGVGNTIDWQHHTDDGTLFLTSIGDVACYRNGEVTGDFVGFGTAELGDSGSCTYIIRVIDNRPPPEVVCTCGDADRGHGNDADCSDEDNPGNSEGCHRSDNGNAHANTHDECTCEPVPAPGDADEYSLDVSCPDGASYSFAGDVESGDIDISEIL
jgi:hypothetical protein